MTVWDCLSEAVVNGALSEEGFNAYRKRMKAAEDEAIRTGRPVPEAHAFAATEAAKELKGRATQTIMAVDRAYEGASKNEKGLQWGLTDVLAEHVRGTGSGNSLVQNQKSALGTMQSIMSDYLSKVQSKLFGLRHDAVTPVHVVRELYGENTGNALAKEGAKALNASNEWWHGEMGRAKTPVQELNDWRLRQEWNLQKLRDMGQDAAVEFLKNAHDSGALRLRDFENEGKNIEPGDARAEKIFKDTWRKVVYPDSDVVPGEFERGTLADRYGRRRIYEWTSADAWLKFNEEMGVGTGGIGELLHRDVEKKARDLGLVRTLGPDPERTKDILLQSARASGVTPKWISRLEAMYNINSGRAMTPVDMRLALGMQVLRNVLTSVQLGGTLLSSLPDFAFTRATARWYDLDATRIMANYVKEVASNTEDARAAAMRKGLILEVGMRSNALGLRDALTDIQAAPGGGNKWDNFLNGAARATGRMAEFVIRAQGLAHHTQKLRDVIGAEVQESLGQMAAKPMGELSGVESRLLREYGITDKEWDLLRTKGLQDGFVSPARLAREGTGEEKEAASKLLGAIYSIQHIAVPEGNSVTRAFVMAGGAAPGTASGELVRSFMQYKGFGMSALMTTMARATERLADGEGKWSRTQWVSALILESTILGALSNQLKDVVAGKDPEPMDPRSPHAARFWARAFAQGGAGGILGNELQSIFQAQRLDDAARMMTPMGGLGLDAIELLFGPIHGAMNPNQQGTTRETFGTIASQKARKYGRTIWPVQLAIDRYVHDTQTRWFDPEAAQTFQRMRENARKQGTSYWWGPGSGGEPQRAPNLGNAAP